LEERGGNRHLLKVHRLETKKKKKKKNWEGATQEEKAADQGRPAFLNVRRGALTKEKKCRSKRTEKGEAGPGVAIPQLLEGKRSRKRASPFGGEKKGVRSKAERAPRRPSEGKKGEKVLAKRGGGEKK